MVTWKVEEATTLTCHSQSVPKGLYRKPKERGARRRRRGEEEEGEERRVREEAIKQGTTKRKGKVE